MDSEADLEIGVPGSSHLIEQSRRFENVTQARSNDASLHDSERK